MNRKGSAIAIAIILGTVFFIAVSALLQHSSGEMKHVKAISAVKKAELLAISGIDWAESQLRVNRWYGTDFVPYEQNKGKHDTCGIKELTPFGSNEGTVTVICEDVANKTPGHNMYGMQQIWFLHHINVYALGQFENQKCLVYGRYIISPEPILNSKSTDGAGFASPEHGVPGAIAVAAEMTKVNGEDVSDFVVKEIKVYESDSVDENKTLFILNPLGNSDSEIKVHPHTFGQVAEIKVNEGQTVHAGDTLLLLKKSIDTGGSEATMKTLKKMVRITKIPPEIWKDLDIYNRNDRFALSQYITGISDAFLQNFVAHSTLETSLKNMGSNKLESKLSSAEVLDKFPIKYSTTTRNRAENSFLAHMIKNFTAPGGTWERKEKALKSTYLKLDQNPNTQLPSELSSLLAKYNLSHLTNTKPRVNRSYFNPKMKNDEFMTLLSPHLNQPPEEFIKNLSELPDASRKITFEDGDFGESYVNNEDENGIEIINPDEGFKVTVEKITKKYTFVDPESGFAIEMSDLMAFLKKYYDDEGSQSPREDVRVNEHIDWPLPAPAPEPPAAIPGGTWVWNEGTPGEPPGDPKYTHTGGSDVDIRPPTAGNGGYEPTIPGDLDGGRKDWEVPGIDGTEGKENKEESENKEEEPGSITLCNCNGDNCCICNPSETKENIKINKNTKWDVVPGTPGKPPTQGHYTWQPDPPAPEPGSEGSDGTPGGGSGGGSGNDGESPGSGGGGGSSGGGTPGGGGSSGGGGGGSSGPAPRYSSGCC